MKKTVLFLILDQFSDWESAYLSSFILALGEGCFCVKTVSLTKDCVHSLGGFTVLPDYDIASVPEDYEALILVGGLSWRNEAAKQVVPLVRHTLKNNKILGAICDASAFLGTIGVLNDIKHTSNDLNDLKRFAGAAYTGENNFIRRQAVRDKNIITANGTASLEFTKEVMLALDAAPENKVTEWYDFYKRGACKVPMPKM